MSSRTLLGSFKVRIAALSVLLSGLVLAGLTVLVVRDLSARTIRRVDREILAIGEGRMSNLPPPTEWSRLDESIAFVHGSSADSRIVVKVLSTAHDVLHCSADWPTELGDLPLPARAEPQPRERRPDDERRGEAPDEGRIGPPPFAEPPRHRPEGGPRPPRREGPREVLPFTVEFVSRRIGQSGWRVGIFQNSRVILLIAADLHQADREVAEFATRLGIVIPLALLVLACGGWVLARQALRPIRRIADAAAAITAADLERRIPAEQMDEELLHLVTVINSMLERLQAGFEQSRRFSADAAHELNTPLTILQGSLERSVGTARAGSEEQQHASDMLDEVHRLKEIVETLLLLARSDSGKLAIGDEVVHISGLLADALEDLPVIAPALTVSAQIAPGLTVKGSRRLLAQAVQNLVTNAVKYNRPGGHIAVTAGRNAASDLEIEIGNSGRPIPVELQPRVFDRFVRGDLSRSRCGIAGSGLGLSLVKAIVREHRGLLILVHSNEQETRFRITLQLPQAG